MIAAREEHPVDNIYYSDEDSIDARAILDRNTPGELDRQLYLAWQENRPPG